MKFKNILAAFVSLFAFSCSNTTYNALRSTDVSEDSLTFSFLDMNCNTESGIYYKVMYNDSALVLESCVLNETTQQKILVKGLSVWIDTTDKMKKETGVVFPYHRDPRVQSEGGRPDPFADAEMKKLPPRADVQLWRSENAAVVLSADSGIDARMMMNKNNVLLIRIAMNFDVLGFRYESLKSTPFSVIMTTAPLIANKPQGGGPDNGAETGNPQMYGSNNQNPFGQSSSGNYGNPGGGSYGESGPGGGSGGAQENSSAIKSDKIVVKHIILKL